MKKESLILIACFLSLYIVFGPVVGAFCFTYSINTWLGIMGRDPCVVWWQGALLGCLPGIGHLSLVVGAITWVSTLFIL